MKSDTFRFDRVLLIDDNDIDNFINERMITTNHFGKQVVVKNSGDLALNYLKEHQSDPNTLPQIIFLDLNMPVMDGFAFLEEYDKLSDTVKKSCQSSSCTINEFPNLIA